MERNIKDVPLEIPDDDPELTERLLELVEVSIAAKFGNGQE